MSGTPAPWQRAEKQCKKVSPIPSSHSRTRMVSRENEIQRAAGHVWTACWPAKREIGNANKTNMLQTSRDGLRSACRLYSVTLRCCDVDKVWVRHITLIGMHKLLPFTVQLRPLHTFMPRSFFLTTMLWRYGLVYSTLSVPWSCLLHRTRQDLLVMSVQMCCASLRAVIPPAASDVVRHTFPPAPARTSSQHKRLAQEAPEKEANIAYLVP